MWIRHVIVLAGLIASVSAARAQEFRIEDVSSLKNRDATELKSGTIFFADQAGAGAVNGTPNLIRFDDWARNHPNQKRFLALFPSYSESTVGKAPAGGSAQAGDKEKLYMYVAQARFVVDRPPNAIDLSRYVTLAFLERIDPAIKHRVLAAGDVSGLKDQQGSGNENPDRKWCTGREILLCFESTYRLEGKIPIGILLVNKLRDSSKKIADHIDFKSELSLLSAADIDQAAIKQLTALDTPISGVLEQNIFHVNQIMRFAKFFGVFQAHPADPNRTIVTAYMALAIEAGVLDKKREFENVPVLRNLVPAQVLMGQSSFNSGNSISAGLPQYARNEIRTIAGILERDKGK